ncbi:hypothetical protein [Paucibacter soli]|uniref:hypothetical protein n=1 Tax=Paucibacter soli TaxID=3133433 RepID=UPI00309ABE0B
MHSKRNKHQPRQLHQQTADARPAPISTQVQARRRPQFKALVSQPVAHSPASNNSKVAGESPSHPPVGYALVDDAFYEIAPRDMVYFGGRHPYWMSARRAGEIGSMRRFSMAIAVARHFA